MDITYKQLALERKQLTLVVNPGKDNQRALWKAQANRADHMANAITKARSSHPGEPLAWLTPDGDVLPVIP